MAKEWIADLAQDIRQKEREAAENFGREQHKSGIITEQGKPFFAALCSALEVDLNEVKRQLQGDVTSSETTFRAVNPAEVRLNRSRFPWFDARVLHRDATIVLDYAKGLGIAGDPSIDRKVSHFDLQVDSEDNLSIQEAFGDTPRQFRQPDDLARHILEILFSV